MLQLLPRIDVQHRTNRGPGHVVALLTPLGLRRHPRDVKFRLKRRVKKMNVCTRCESTMDRRTSIPEGAGRRYWGDVEPYVYVGDAEIHHFICMNCGNLTAIQFREAA